MDTNRAEFEAMTDVFLGISYDRKRLQEVDALRVALHEGQSILAHQLQSGELAPVFYVDFFNRFARAIFARIEQVLGPDDFEKMFGLRRDGIGDLIDRDAFLRDHAAAHQMRTASI